MDAAATSAPARGSQRHRARGSRSGGAANKTQHEAGAQADERSEANPRRGKTHKESGKDGAEAVRAKRQQRAPKKKQSPREDSKPRSDAHTPKETSTTQHDNDE